MHALITASLSSLKITGKERAGSSGLGGFPVFNSQIFDPTSDSVGSPE